MRIQHNIMAMNSYRNYNNNTKALSKNLEKLSSGYKINRAGDDAAGLAISEKMRAQITGLEAAQKNVKDGISLVNTAEGALQEVQNMMNRMVYLAQESANGTFDNEVDRKSLQDEVDQLRSEINRIADSANFNGIKLLDGSLSTEGATSTKGSSVDLSKLGVDLLTSATNVSAVKNKQASGVFFSGETTPKKVEGLVNGDKLSMKIDYTDANGVSQTKELTFKIGKDQTLQNDAEGIWLDDGSENGVWLADLGATGDLEAGEFADAAKKALEMDSNFKAAFDITKADNLASPGTDGLTFESRKAGTEGAKVNGLYVSVTKKSDKGVTPNPEYKQVTLDTTTQAEDGLQAIDFTTATGKGMIFDVNADPNDSTDKLTTDINEAIFEINGEKFAFIQANGEKDIDFQEALRKAGVTHWVEVAADDTIAAADIAKMVNKISTATGLKVDQGNTTVNATTGGVTWAFAAAGTKVVFRPADPVTTKTASGGLQLQIGDTSDSYNQLTVNVKDMHTKAMGIDNISVATQSGAQAAVDVIKDAINYVSSVRGTLGAISNRLDHTANNLSVMRENIQDAESTIRDTDVAEEMMSYTKNNILVQSAQAMLAQANQVPQGVLQLLQ